jgi:phospholipase C
VDNGNFPIPFQAPSIFRLLSNQNVSWRVYFHDVPQSLLLGDIWLSAPLHYRFFDQFIVDAQNGALPGYSFIEPRYFTDAFLRNIPNDEHPPHNVLFGEQLIARVYTALRQSPAWKNTLFIITFDEHGGCYDHMPPPAAVPPDNYRQDGFAFDRYGVRVPAVIVSPYIPAGLKLRAAPQGLPLAGPPYPFDHTSILATLRTLFGLGPPLSAREAVAPNLLAALSLTVPDNDGPEFLSASPPSVSSDDAAARARLPPNHMQESLDRMARSLPVRAFEEGTPAPSPMVASVAVNVAQAQASATMRVKDFLNL